MNKNEFKVKRTAVGDFLVPLVATTVTSDVIVPAGAIVTGIRLMPPSALYGSAASSAAASATVQLFAGAEALCAAIEFKNLPAETVMATTAVTSAEGFYVATGGNLQLQVGSSVNSAASGTFNYYVDYIYVGS